MVTTYKTEKHEFFIPGILPVQADDIKAIEQFKNMPFDGEIGSGYSRVLFRIEVDREGVKDSDKDGNGKIISNAMQITDRLSIKGEENSHMLMAMPKLAFDDSCSIEG